jgi:hypothetical protein
MKIARYASEDVNSDKKKRKCFRRGLNASLREQLVTHIYPNFNTLMNRTILLEEECVIGPDTTCSPTRKDTTSLHQQHRTHKVSANYAV